MTYASIRRRPSLRTGERIGQRYQVVAFIGAGGMGEVYEAIHIVTGRRLALKILLLHLHDSAETFERLLREATVTARVEHDNVIECIDCGFARDGRPYLVMPRLFGLSLRCII